MKKMIAFLMALTMLCAACAATADMEIPLWEDMPEVVMEEDGVTVDEAAFAGEWVLNVAFAGRDYVMESDLFDLYGYNFMPYVIGEGKITQDFQQENGEFVTLEAPYTFESGQLQGTDLNGRDFAVDLLEDGNIVLSIFYPGEDETMICLSVFLKHPEE